MGDDRLIDAMAQAIGVEAGMSDGNWDCEARAAHPLNRNLKKPRKQNDRH